MGEPPRHVGRACHVTLPDLHVPQREFRFRVREEVRLSLRGLPHVGQCLLPVTAAQQPTGAPGHFGVDDVVDPRACDARSDVLSIVCEHSVEGPSRFPVLVPTGLPPQGSELEPDVVQVQLTEEEQRRFVVWGGPERPASQFCPRWMSARNSTIRSGRRAMFERTFLAGRPWSNALS